MSTRTYAGIPAAYSSLDTSKIVLIPVPYDGTSTWQKGADKGPEAFLKASENMELYDIMFAGNMRTNTTIHVITMEIIIRILNVIKIMILKKKVF